MTAPVDDKDDYTLKKLSFPATGHFVLHTKQLQQTLAWERHKLLAWQCQAAGVTDTSSCAQAGVQKYNNEHPCLTATRHKLQSSP